MTRHLIDCVSLGSPVTFNSRTGVASTARSGEFLYEIVQRHTIVVRSGNCGPCGRGDFGRTAICEFVGLVVAALTEQLRARCRSDHRIEPAREGVGGEAGFFDSPTDGPRSLLNGSQ